MFAGHIGVGLAAARFAPQVNAGVWVVAALLLDALLWALVLTGVESVRIPPDFAATHQPHFEFPFTHGLLATLAWSVLAGALAFVAVDGPAKRVVALAVAAVVFSHWLLDALVHRAELPLAGADSVKLGLGLWNAPAVALAVEAGLLVAGLVLYLRSAALPRKRAIGIAVLSLLLLAFTIAGMTVAPPPPSASAMAASSLGTLAVVCALYAWLARR